MFYSKIVPKGGKMVFLCQILPQKAHDNDHDKATEQWSLARQGPESTGFIGVEANYSVCYV